MSLKAEQYSQIARMALSTADIALAWPCIYRWRSCAHRPIRTHLTSSLSIVRQQQERLAGT